MTIPLILQVTLILSLSLLAGWAMQRASASSRHAIYLAGLLGALLLPAFSFLGTLTPESARVIEIPVTSVTAVTAAFPVQTNWLAIARWLWLAGMALFGLRYIAGAARAWWLLKTAQPLEDDVFLHPSVRVPLAVGWWNVRTVLPEAARNWPSTRRAAAIAHESAHAARRDGLWQGAAAAVCAVYWFHPLIWLVAARLRQEAERSCDDAVLLAGIDARAYANDLVETAREAAGHWNFAATIAMAAPSQLESRVIAVLDPHIARTPLTRRALTVVSTLSLVTMLIVTGAITGIAQELPAGRVEVTVVDPSGARVPGASVTIDNGRGGIKINQNAGADGVARIDALPPGDYLIEVHASGFRAATKGVRLTERAGARAAVALDLGMLTETVAVQGGTMPAGESKPERLRIGGNVQAAKLLTKVVPVYPREAKDQRIQGIVFLTAVISKEGAVRSLEVLSSPDPVLSTAAIDAVRQWTYEPTLLNGNPVEVITRIDIHFTLAP